MEYLNCVMCGKEFYRNDLINLLYCLKCHKRRPLYIKDQLRELEFPNFEISKYNFNNNNLNVYILENNEIWFKGKDVAEILEYKDTAQAIKKHVDKEYKQPLIKITGRRIDGAYKLNEQDHELVINEQGLYSLIFKSKKEEAIKFRKWVFEEVLPSIRKTGSFSIIEQNKKKQREIDWFCDHQS